jgi:hypothetical protein
MQLRIQEFGTCFYGPGVSLPISELPENLSDVKNV